MNINLKSYRFLKSSNANILRRSLLVTVIILGIIATCILAISVSDTRKNSVSPSQASTLTLPSPCVTVPNDSYNQIITNPAYVPQSISTLNAIDNTLQKSITKVSVLKTAKTQQTNSNESINTANARKYNLIQTMRNNPSLALDYINSSKKYLQSINNCTERKITLEGDITNVEIDNFKNKTKSTQTFLVTKNNQTYNLHLQQNKPLKDHVKLTGFLLDSDFIVDPLSDVNSKSAILSPLDLPIQLGGNNTTGQQNLMVGVVNFTDASKITYTNDQLSSIFTGTDSFAVNNFYNKYSYGKTYFQETMVYDLDIGIPQTCDYTLIKDATIKAIDKKLDITKFNRLSVLFHNASCTYGGLGEVSGSVLPSIYSSYGIAHLSTNIIPVINLGENGVFTSFSDFYNFTIHVVDHELGHNLGLNHANFLNCNPSELNLPKCSYSNAESTLYTPTNIEYGSFVSQMGSVGGFDATEKDKLKWFNNKLGASTEIATVTTSGDYTVLPLDGNTSCVLSANQCGYRAYRIGILNDPTRNFLNSLYLSYIPIVDSTTPIIKSEGIVLNTFTSDYHTELIDPHRLLNSVSDSELDTRLKIGETFIDPQSNSKILVKSVSTEGIKIHIDIGKIDFTPPSIQITSPSTNNTTVSGVITIKTLVSSILGIDHVEFYKVKSCDINSKTLVGQASSSPFSFDLDTSLINNGNMYGIYAIAYDKSGIAFNAPANRGYSGCIFINVLNTPTELPPVVDFATPVNGSTVSNPVTFTVSTIHNESINNIDYYLDDPGNSYLLCSSVSFPFACYRVSLPSGNHSITLKAYDHSGRIIQKSIGINIPNSTTSITITSPADGQQLTNFVDYNGVKFYFIKADIKSTNQITSAYVAVDGTSICSLSIVGTYYGCYLPVSSFTVNSSHYLTAFATDSSGSVLSSKMVTITIGGSAIPTLTPFPTIFITKSPPRPPLVSGGPVLN